MNNEVRLIDANKLIKTLRELEWITDNPCDGDNVLEDIINNAPTVECPEQIIIKCDTEEEKQKLLSALRNARLTICEEEEE